MTDETTMTTYRMKDGTAVDNFGWVSTLDWFDDYDKPVELIKEVWVRRSVEELRLTEQCSEIGCTAEATHWGLCEQHAREDDPEAFDD